MLGLVASFLKGAFDGVCRRLRIVLDFAFPKPKHGPALLFQLPGVPLIPLHVRPNLRNPIISVGSFR